MERPFPGLRKSIQAQVPIGQFWLLLKASSVECWLIEKIREKGLSTILGFCQGRSERGYSTALGATPPLQAPRPTFSVLTVTRCPRVFPHPRFLPCAFSSLAGQDLICPLVTPLSSDWPGAPLHPFCNFPGQTSPLVPSWLSLTCSLLGILCFPVCSRINVSLALPMAGWTDREISLACSVPNFAMNFVRF